MTLLFDAVSSAQNDDLGSLTFSHTCSGTDRVLYVGFSLGARSSQGQVNASSQTATVTYGGVSLTQLATVSQHLTGRIWLFRLVAPATGANDVVVDISDLGDIQAGAISFTGADQTTPDDTPVTNTSASSPISATVSSEVGDAVIDVVGSGSGLTTHNQTSRWVETNNAQTGGSNGAGATADGAASVTMTREGAANEVFAIIAVNINAAAGGTSATVEPTTVAANASVSAPTLSAGSTISPDTVESVTSVPAPVLAAGSVISLSTVQAIVLIPAPVLEAGAVPEPSTVQAITSIFAPDISAGSVVSPNTVLVVVDIPLPDITTGGDITINAATVQALVSIAAPGIQTGVNVSPNTVPVIANLPSPAVHGGAVIAPDTVLVAVSIPAPSISTELSAQIIAATVHAIVQIFQPVITGVKLLWVNNDDTEVPTVWTDVKRE